MILYKHELTSELQFRSTVLSRLLAAVRKMPESEKSSIIALFFELYDSIGMGIREYCGELRWNTLQNAMKPHPTASSITVAKWNPSFFIRSDEISPIFGPAFEHGDKPLLDSIIAEYSAVYPDDVSDEQSGPRFWSLWSSIVKEFRNSPDYKNSFPGCEVVIVGNGSGEGAEATIWVNEGQFPADFWDGAYL